MEKRLALYVEIRGVLAILRGSEDLVKKGAKFCFDLPPPPMVRVVSLTLCCRPYIPTRHLHIVASNTINVLYKVWFELAVSIKLLCWSNSYS